MPNRRHQTSRVFRKFMGPRNLGAPVVRNQIAAVASDEARVSGAAVVWDRVLVLL
jgi:hypothetical protein